MHQGYVLRTEFSPDPKPGRRPGVPDSAHDSLVHRQRRGALICRDVVEEPVLDLVPLTRPGLWLLEAG